MYLKVSSKGVLHLPLVELLPPATKLRQGNIFTSVCQEFCPQGACVARGCAWQGGMCGWGGHMWQRGHAWQGCVCGGGMHGRGHAWCGACMAEGHAWQEKRQLQWAVRILLECILVAIVIARK